MLQILLQIANNLTLFSEISVITMWNDSQNDMSVAWVRFFDSNNLDLYNLLLFNFIIIRPKFYVNKKRFTVEIECYKNIFWKYVCFMTNF